MNQIALPRMVPLKSSNIEAIGHDGGKHELHVKFKNGGHYVYENVHRVFFDNMCAAPSPGGYHETHVKTVFKHRKL